MEVREVRVRTQTSEVRSQRLEVRGSKFASATGERTGELRVTVSVLIEYLR